MATILTMPGISAGSESAQILNWLKSEGDQISIDDPILEIETDKAVVEVNAEQNGKLAKILVDAGEVALVGSAIGILLAENEGATELALIMKEVSDQQNGDNGIDVNNNTSAQEQSPQADQSYGKQIDPEIAMENTKRVFASPLARRMAKEANLDLSIISGSGPHSRIIKKDIIKALEITKTEDHKYLGNQQDNSLVTYADSYGSSTAIPHTGMRRTIAKRLTESKQNIPHFYLKAVCKVDALLQLRSQINNAPNIKVSVNDLIVKAASLALQETPEMNVIWTTESMLQCDGIDISVAVSTDTGLITPVVRNANHMTISKLSDQIKMLAERARAGKLSKEEYTGGSFTISNLGMYGVKEFSAIINPPQSAILAVGCAKKEPVIEDDNIIIAQTIDMTLSVDHRAIDGAVAAQWLAKFKDIIENPFTILI